MPDTFVPGMLLADLGGLVRAEVGQGLRVTAHQRPGDYAGSYGWDG
jgi:hypothetical protein